MIYSLRFSCQNTNGQWLRDFWCQNFVCFQTISLWWWKMIFKAILSQNLPTVPFKSYKNSFYTWTENMFLCLMLGQQQSSQEFHINYLHTQHRAQQSEIETMKNCRIIFMVLFHHLREWKIVKCERGSGITIIMLQLAP